MLKILKTTAAVAALSLGSPILPAVAQESELLHSWVHMDWAFPDEDARDAFLDAGVQTQAPLHGVEMDVAGTIYVTTPRILNADVPATFNRVTMVEGRPVLEPWPSWEAHDLGDPQGLRNILGAAIDGENRVWLLDKGYVAGEDRSPDGAQKLVVFDVATGAELERFPIGPELADPATSFLNDLAIDEASGFVFISDTGMRGGGPTPSGIIVYDTRSGEGRRVLHAHPSVQNDPERPLQVDGEDVFPDNPLMAGINGIALSPDGGTLYWSITTGDAIYRIDAALLHDPSVAPERLAAAVEGPFRPGGGSDGIAFGPDGQLWVTDVTNNRILTFDTETEEFDIVVEGDEFIWPDTLAPDLHGGMLASTNHLNHAFAGVMEFDGAEPNFRIFRITPEGDFTQ